MAKIIVDKYITLGANTPLVATSYQVALDKNFTQIVDEIHESVEHKLSWITPLPKRGEPGKYYGNEVSLWARIKLFLRDDNGVLYASDDWFVLPEGSQPEWNNMHISFTGEFDQDDIDWQEEQKENNRYKNTFSIIKDKYKKDKV